MKYSDDARKTLTQYFEGFSAKAYPDPGTGGVPWTIGFGHTGNVLPGDTCTREEADAWLIEDIATAEKAVNGYVEIELTQNQFDALVDFTYNVGAGNLAKSTLLKKINAGNTAEASKEFKKWVYANGKTLSGLVKRRNAETAWFLKP